MKTIFFIPPFFRLMGSYNNKVGPSIMASANILSLHADAIIYNADAIDGNVPYADWYSVAKNYWSYRRYIELLERGDFERLPGLVESITFLFEQKPDLIILCCGDPAIPTVDIGGIEILHFLAPVIRKYVPTSKIAGYGFAYEHNPSLARDVDFVIPSYGESTMYQVGSFVTEIWPRELNRLHLDALQHNIPPIYPEVDVSSFDYVMASRGCAWGRCVFCPHSANPPGCVSCSPVWFADEVAYRYSLGIHYQYFADMNFLDKSDVWIKSWKNLIKTNYHLPKLTFSLETRADSVTSDKLLMLKKAGLTTVKLGLEGATNNLLQLYRKGITMSQVDRAVSIIRDLDLKLVLYLLLGHPGATPDDYKASLVRAKEIGADYYVINIACPYQGTELFRMVKDQLEEAGLIKDGIEHGFTHLSDDLRNFWHIPEDLFDEFLQLSANTVKEDHGVTQKRSYTRNILTQ
jgi:radical SAM superfamily enzyme YgiQ (UPF0313 family)